MNFFKKYEKKNKINTKRLKIRYEYLEVILKNRAMVIVTLSFDGVGDVHDYVRWPIKWKNYTK